APDVAVARDGLGAGRRDGAHRTGAAVVADEAPAVRRRAVVARPAVVASVVPVGAVERRVVRPRVGRPRVSAVARRTTPSTPVAAPSAAGGGADHRGGGQRGAKDEREARAAGRRAGRRVHALTAPSPGSRGSSIPTGSGRAPPRSRGCRRSRRTR